MKTIFAKYNSERLPQFQIVTTISKDDETFIVKKKPLTINAESHIKTIYANYLLQKQHYKLAKIAKVSLDKDALTFEYLNGKSLDSIILEAVLKKNKNLFLDLLNNYVIFIKNLGAIQIDNFKSDPQFTEVFGETIELKNVFCLQISNIDLIFDNIIQETNSTVSIIDYEWVFNFCIPIDFIIYRSISIFITKYSEYINKIISKEDIYQFLNIDNERIKLFEKLENGFQNYVFGRERYYMIKNNYLKETKTLPDIEYEIIFNKNKIVEIESWTKSLEDDIIVKDKEIKELKEELKKQIVQIEEVILWAKSLNEENLKKDKQIERLLVSENLLNNILNSKGWKFLKILYRIRDFSLYK